MIRKAVIPAAGLGTRVLPVTKVLPKEMLPIVDQPAIEVVVEEAVAAGVEDILLVTARNKRALEDHFDRYPELEDVLKRRGKERELEQVRHPAELASVHSVRQQLSLGLGHAVLTARRHVGGEPFAVLLPDDLILSRVPALRQMVDALPEGETSMIAVEEVDEQRVQNYGIIAGEDLGGGLFRVTDLVEKPTVDKAPSRLAVVGRYLLQPIIFDYLERTSPGHGGEIQITDALRQLAKEHPLYALRVRGERHDTGSPLGLLKAQIAYALARDDLADDLREYLRYQLERTPEPAWR